MGVRVSCYVFVCFIATVPTGVRVGPQLLSLPPFFLVLHLQGCSVPSFFNKEIKKGITTVRCWVDDVIPFLISCFWSCPDLLPERTRSSMRSRAGVFSCQDCLTWLQSAVDTVDVMWSSCRRHVLLWDAMRLTMSTSCGAPVDVTCCSRTQ